MTDADVPAAEQLPPEGPDDATIEALGKLGEALEAVEAARGFLYAFHRLSGTADLILREGVEALRKAGHVEVAEEIESELVGRAVLPGRWTFQIVEAYDDGYWSAFRQYERKARELLAGGRRHLHEAGMKESERSRGRPGHESRPPDPARS